MTRFRDFFGLLMSMSPEEIEEGGRRGASNVDALAAASRDANTDPQGGEWAGAIPPNYIKTYDEGRPPH